MNKISYVTAAAAITAVACAGCSTDDKDSAATTTVNGTAVAAAKNAQVAATFDGKELTLADAKCAKTGGQIAMTGGKVSEPNSTSVVVQLDEAGSTVNLVSFTNAPGGGVYTYTAGMSDGGSKPSLNRDKSNFTISGSISKMAVGDKGAAKDFTIKATCPGI